MISIENKLLFDLLLDKCNITSTSFSQMWNICYVCGYVTSMDSLDVMNYLFQPRLKWTIVLQNIINSSKMILFHSIC